MNKIAIRLATVILLSLVFFGMYKEDPNANKGFSKVTTNDLKDHININQIDMLFQNNGIGSYNGVTSGAGLYWPKGTIKTSVFEDGLLIGGKVGSAGEVRVGGSTYNKGLQAGQIINGVAQPPSDPKYKIWKIKRDWEYLPEGTEKTRLKYDYENWPIDQGAPYEIDAKTGLKVPKYVGDEVDWMVMNDMDASRTVGLYGTQPMGLEVQQTIFGFNKTGDLGNMVFKKYKIINKGSNIIRDVVLSMWVDPDLGYGFDDYVGCDTNLSIGYVYNGKSQDGTGAANEYGLKPPALCYDFFQGPVIPYDPVAYPIINEKHLPDSAKFDGKWVHGKTNLPLTSFAFYVNSNSTYKDPDLGQAQGSTQMYNYMNSKLWDGTYFLDPTKTPPAPVNFCLYGDPIAKTGWYEGAGWPGGLAPGDRRMTLSSGKFTFAPGDTQEVVVGIVIGLGTDNLNSISVMKNADKAAQLAYDFDFNLVKSPPAPVTKFAALDKKIELYWDVNAESYESFDPLLGGKKLADTSYKFQGYLIYQYQDAIGSNPKLLATYDIVDSISTVLDSNYTQGQSIIAPIVEGTNSGLRRTMEITTDAYTNQPLRNGTPYYFSVVSYAYCGNEMHKVLLSTPVLVEVYPNSLAVGDQFTYNAGSLLNVTSQAAAPNDGVVAVKVIDPTALTGHDYEVFMTGTDTLMRWNLRDITTGDTLLKKMAFEPINTTTYKNNGFDYTLNAMLVDGFAIKVGSPTDQTNIVKEVVMTKDGGKTVAPSGVVAPLIPRAGVNVFGVATASTRNWWITSIGASGAENLQAFVNDGGGKEGVYEVRFTDTANASQFYSFSDKRPIANPKTSRNSLGKNKIPLTAWDMTNAAAPKQFYLKAYDKHPLLFSDTASRYPGGTVIDSTWSASVVNFQRLVADSIAYEDIYFFADSNGYVSPLPAKSNLSVASQYPVEAFDIMSHTLTDFPSPGTVIDIYTWRKIKTADKFTFTATKPKKNDATVGKSTLDRISVFPNPYFGAHELEQNRIDRFVRFTNLPPVATIKIYTIAGTYVARVDKNDQLHPFVDWNLTNYENIPVASGMFLAYVEIPGVGTKILKIAIIQESRYLDKL